MRAKKPRRKTCRRVGTQHRRKRKPSSKAKPRRTVSRKKKRGPARKKCSKKKRKKCVWPKKVGKGKRRYFFEDEACGKHLPREFGPCDTRKRRIVLAEIGFVSQTLTSKGVPREISKTVRFLEHDYVRNNVLSYMPAFMACLDKLRVLCPELKPCLNSKTLAALKAICIVFEIDGIQHRDVVDWLPGKKENAIHRFLAQRENDQIKDMCCIVNHILQKRVKNYIITPNLPKGRVCTLAEFMCKLRIKVWQMWKEILKRVVVGLFLSDAVTIPAHIQLQDMLFRIDSSVPPTEACKGSA